MFSGAGVVRLNCPLSPVAGALGSENGGATEPRGTGPTQPLHQLLSSSSAFQLASGLGAFRYPELIKVCDRFQLECEFLPETLTIRSPKHGAVVNPLMLYTLLSSFPAGMCGLGTIPNRSPNRRPTLLFSNCSC